MGYYTSFYLSVAVDANAVLLGDSRRKEIMQHLIDLSEDNSAYWGIFRSAIEQELLDGQVHDMWSPEESCKWYDHDKDMKALSLRFQDVVFMLHGEGEEEEDKWNKYYLNGQVQACQAKITIEYEPFDINKLKVIEDRRNA